MDLMKFFPPFLYIDMDSPNLISCRKHKHRLSRPTKVTGGREERKYLLDRIGCEVEYRVRSVG